MTTFKHLTYAAAARRGPKILFALAALAGLSLALGCVATPARGTEATGAYGWPVKPFDKPHPVRGNFGDPRTTFDRGPATPDVLWHSRGTFDHHFGIDIAVPDGTPVYPIQSGTAQLRSAETITVASEGTRSFDYWHIVPAVHAGQHVTAFRTVLGHVRKGYEHVHLTELEAGRPVNPLAPGHLGPYSDGTRPHVASISFRRPGTPQAVLPEFVRGRVELIAAAYDVPALRVPGRWGGLPVAPALVAWKIVRATDGRVVRRTRIPFDVRRHLPRGSLWRTYARGTRQNMSTFAGHRYWRQPGVYLYRLGRDSFDTRKLQNGIYDLVVTAADARGNKGSLTQRFTVLN